MGWQRISSVFLEKPGRANLDEPLPGLACCAATCVWDVVHDETPQSCVTILNCDYTERNTAVHMSARQTVASRRLFKMFFYIIKMRRLQAFTHNARTPIKKPQTKIECWTANGIALADNIVRRAFKETKSHNHPIKKREEMTENRNHMLESIFLPPLLPSCQAPRFGGRHMVNPTWTKAHARLHGG